MPRLNSGLSIPPPSESSTQLSEGRKLEPLPLRELPRLPQAIRAHPRNELQRRNSPTRGGDLESFSPRSPCFPPTRSQSPAGTALAVQRVSTWPIEIKVDGPIVAVEEKQERKEKREEEESYSLTLLTNPSLTDNATKLCLNPSTSCSPLPPANITLFPTLPASNLAQIKGHLFLLSDQIKAFELSTGTPTKTHTGQTLLGLSQGEREIRRLFVALRTSWWTLLNGDDRAYQGVGWPLFNDKDEVDVATVHNMEREIREAGEVKGWASGMCLWRKKEGIWEVEQEFGFKRDDRMVDKNIRVRVRSLMSPSAEDLALKRASSVERRPISV